MKRTTSIPYFHVGQRIVCVDTAPNKLSAEMMLTRGRIYTVRAIDLGHWKPPGWGLHLDGIELSYPGMDGVAWAFNPKRFRPVGDRPTDIEVFKKLLVATLAEGGE